MTKLRVLFLASGFFKVGDYFRFKALAEELVRKGHQVTILTGDLKFRLCWGEELINGVKWIYPPYIGGVRLAEKLTNFLPETKIFYDVLLRIYFLKRFAVDYDIIHGFHVGLNTYLPLASIRRCLNRPKIVFDWCDLWENGIIRPPQKGLYAIIDYRLSVRVETLSIRNADAITVNNNYLHERSRLLGKTDSDICLIRDGAPTSTIKPIQKRRARKNLNLDEDTLILGFSGFFHPDTKFLLETFAIVRRKLARPVKLLFVGSLGLDLRNLLVDLAIEHDVLYMGPIEHDDIGNYLSACDYLLLPFTDRPVNLARWPFKLGDYLACGRAVVAGGYGEVAAFFRQNPEIGMLCEDSKESFSDTIVRIVNDPDFATGSEDKIRRVAETKLNWNVSAINLERFYFDLLENKSEL